MTRNNILLLTVLGLLAFGVVCYLFLFSGAKTLTLSNPVNTVATGYPFAVQIKDSLERNSYLSGVIVDLDCATDSFKVRTITYAFRTKNKDHVLFVVVDNASRTASALGAAETPRDPKIPSFVFQELNLSKISKDIPEVLEIAKATKLAEFLKIVPPDARNLSLTLGGSASGGSWHLGGDGWDEKGPIADLHIEINPETGAIINQTLDKGVGRPR